MWKFDEKYKKKNMKEDINNVLEEEFKCVKPVVPGEDLFEDTSETKKNSILEGLKTLKSNLDKAIGEDDEKKASEFVRKSFGERFPLGKEAVNSSFATSKSPGVLKHDGRSA